MHSKYDRQLRYGGDYVGSPERTCLRLHSEYDCDLLHGSDARRLGPSSNMTKVAVSGIPQAPRDDRQHRHSGDVGEVPSSGRGSLTPPALQAMIHDEPWTFTNFPPSTAS